MLENSPETNFISETIEQKSFSNPIAQAFFEELWQIKKGPIQDLQEKTNRGIKKLIETPKRELSTAIFARGVRKLITEIKEFNWDPALEQRKLYEVLEIPKLKEELAQTRETGNVKDIAKKELEIARKIQRAVCRFRYKEGANNPSEMVKNQFINCLGSSILGGGLLDEVGIKYLHMSLPRHSATILITSDKKAYWQDFTSSYEYMDNHEITNDRLGKDREVSEEMLYVISVETKKQLEPMKNL